MLSFLLLPPEIRSMIYEYTFPAEVAVGKTRTASASSQQCFALALSCRAIHDETIRMLHYSRISHVRLFSSLCASEFAKFVASAPAIVDPCVAALTSFSVDARVGFIFSPYLMQFHRLVFTFARPAECSPPDLEVSKPLSGNLFVAKACVIHENKPNPDFIDAPKRIRQRMKKRKWGDGFCARDLVWLTDVVGAHADFQVTTLSEKRLRELWAGITDVGRNEGGPELVYRSRFVEKE